MLGHQCTSKSHTYTVDALPMWIGIAVPETLGNLVPLKIENGVRFIVLDHGECWRCALVGLFASKSSRETIASPLLPEGFLERVKA